MSRKERADSSNEMSGRKKGREKILRSRGLANARFGKLVRAPSLRQEARAEMRRRVRTKLMTEVVHRVARAIQDNAKRMTLGGEAIDGVVVLDEADMPQLAQAVIEALAMTAVAGKRSPTTRLGGPCGGAA